MSEQNSNPVPAQNPEPSRLPVWALPVATGVVGFILGSVAVAGVVAAATTVNIDASPTVFADALSKCDLGNSPFAVIEDEGLTLTIESRGKDDFGGLNYEEQECILNALDAPAAVLSHFGQTTSMDGRQEETWDKITMSWSYHPDRGADSVLTYDPS